MKQIKPIFLGLVFCCSASIRAEVFTDANLRWVYEDNVSNAKISTDIVSDRHLDASISIGKFIDFDDGLSLTMVAAVDLITFNKLSDLDHTDLNGSIKLNKKLGLGHWVPSVGTTLSLTQQNSDSNIRDQQKVDLNLFWKKRLDDDWDILVEVGLLEAIADEVPPDSLITPPAQAPFFMAADVFDNNAYYLSVESGYAFSDQYFLEFSYQFLSGDIVSTAAPNPVIRDAADALVSDPAFGVNAVAYKLDADSHTFSSTLNMELNQRASLNVGYQYRSTEANQGIDYDNHLVSLQVFYQF